MSREKPWYRRHQPLRRYFLTGILVLAPTGLTFWILYKVFVFLDTLLGGFLRGEWLRPGGVPGMGFVSLVLLILLVGVLASNLLGRRLVETWERLVGTIPLVNRVYLAIKEISEAVLADRRTHFRRVVLVEYPRRGIYSLAFVMRAPAGILGEQMGSGYVGIFIPTTPNPTSGFFLVVPERDLIPLDLSVEEGLKLVISAGTVMPGEIPADRLRAGEASPPPGAGPAPPAPAPPG
jgi:uncharacterized membrane protein